MKVFFQQIIGNSLFFKAPKVTITTCGRYYSMICVGVVMVAIEKVLFRVFVAFIVVFCFYVAVSFSSLFKS